MEDSPLVAPLSDLGGFPVTLGLILGLGFQSGLLARRALSGRRRASARSRPPVEDSPLTAPLSDIGGFPVKLGFVFGTRLSVWPIEPTCQLINGS